MRHGLNEGINQGKTYIYYQVQIHKKELQFCGQLGIKGFFFQFCFKYNPIFEGPDFFYLHFKTNVFIIQDFVLKLHNLDHSNPFPPTKVFDVGSNTFGNPFIQKILQN